MNKKKVKDEKKPEPEVEAPKEEVPEEIEVVDHMLTENLRYDGINRFVTDFNKSIEISTNKYNVNL